MSPTPGQLHTDEARAGREVDAGHFGVAEIEDGLACSAAELKLPGDRRVQQDHHRARTAALTSAGGTVAVPVTTVSVASWRAPDRLAAPIARGKDPVADNAIS
jgi:hypothetical protein